MGKLGTNYMLHRKNLWYRCLHIHSRIHMHMSVKLLSLWRNVCSRSYAFTLVWYFLVILANVNVFLLAEQIHIHPNCHVRTAYNGYLHCYPRRRATTQRAEGTTTWGIHLGRVSWWLAPFHPNFTFLAFICYSSLSAFIQTCILSPNVSKPVW